MFPLTRFREGLARRAAGEQNRLASLEAKGIQYFRGPVRMYVPRGESWPARSVGCERQSTVSVGLHATSDAEACSFEPKVEAPSARKERKYLARQRTGSLGDGQLNLSNLTSGGGPSVSTVGYYSTSDGRPALRQRPRRGRTAPLLRKGCSDGPARGPPRCERRIVAAAVGRSRRRRGEGRQRHAFVAIE